MQESHLQGDSGKCHLKKDTMKNALILLILLPLSTLIEGSVCADEAPPVIFSFDWPTSAEHSTGDYYHIDLDAASIIEIGPRKSSYPPTKMDNFDPEIAEYWHKRGKRIVRRCYAVRFDENGKKTGFCTTEELIRKWSDALDEPGIDGIAVDEFHSHDEFVTTWMKSFNQVLFETWAEALKTVRQRYPDKLIMVWMWGWGEHSQPILETINKYADYFMPEVYYPEKDAEGFPDFHFPRFREAIDHFEKLVPGISKKILMGVGCHEGLYDNDPDIDYGDFIEAQITAIASDPVLSKLPGVAIYKPAALSPKNIKRLNSSLKEHILQ